LKRIQTGAFAKEWIKEDATGQKKFNKLRKEGERHSIEKVGKRLRSTMPWIKKRDIKGTQASYS
jgi:ketol-acid reductoisomerase